MPIPVLITLSNLGSAVGPFNLYSDVDNYVVPFEQDVPASAFTYGYYTTLVPDGTLNIKIVSEGECVNFIITDIQGLPTPTITPTQTQTCTPTPDVSPSPTPNVTSSPTTTPSITPSQTSTIALTPTQTGTPNVTPTPSITSSPTPSTPSDNLYVYAKFINTADELGYTLNGGAYNAIGTPTTGCTYMATISGLVSGDTLVFLTLLSCSIGGDNSNCPSSTVGCTYTHNYVGTTNVYLTVDASNCC